MTDALVCSRHQHNWALTTLGTSRVYSDALDVFCVRGTVPFGVLQSRVHEVWARFFASSLEERLRYTPTDCFETFPFPTNWETDAMLEAAGREYYEYRAALMIRRNEGLTATYNRFHSPHERSHEILRLRELHAQVDHAVLTAYGWSELPNACEFIADYIEETADGQSVEKSIRHRWPDPVRDEVLARLLTLNAERAREESLLAVAPTGKPKKVKLEVTVSRESKTQLTSDW